MLSTIRPRPGKIFLLPIKKPTISNSGIILEKDKGELLTDTYEVVFDFLSEDSTGHGIMLKPKDRVICSDAAGTNLLIQGVMIKVVDEKDILGVFYS